MGRLFLLHGLNKFDKAKFRKNLVNQAENEGFTEISNFEIDSEKNPVSLTDVASRIKNSSLFQNGRIMVLKIQIEDEKNKKDGSGEKEFFSRSRCREAGGKIANIILPPAEQSDDQTMIIFDFYFELDGKNEFLIKATKNKNFLETKLFKEVSIAKNDNRDSFQFIDAVIDGKIKISLYLLEKIAKEQKIQESDETKIALGLLGLLAFKINRLILLQETENAQMAQKKLGISPYFFNHEKEQSSRFNRKTLFELLKKTVIAQDKAKSGLYSPLSLLLIPIFSFANELRKPQSV